jgi:hypothetical protein
MPTTRSWIFSVMPGRSKDSAEGAEAGRGLGVEVCEAPLNHVAPQFAFQLAETPGLQSWAHSRAGFEGTTEGKEVLWASHGSKFV